MDLENLNPEQLYQHLSTQLATEGLPQEEISNETSEPELEDISKLITEGEFTQDSATSEGDKEAAPSTPTDSSSKKTFKIKDEFGEERDITLDMSDDNLKSIIQKAKDMDYKENEMKAMADQMQSIKVQLDEMKALVAEAKTLKSLSPEEYLDKALAKEGGYSAWLKKQHEEIERGANMTEEELKEFNFKKEQLAKDREIENLRKKIDEAVNGLNQKKEEAEQLELNSWVESATTKFSFNHVFKDNTEKALKWDKRVWAEAQRELKTIQDGGIKLTPAIINKEVQRAFLDLKSDIVREAETKAQESIENQKNKAANAAASSVNAAATQDSLRSEIKKLLDKNDQHGILSLAKKFPTKVVGILNEIRRGI